VNLYFLIFTFYFFLVPLGRIIAIDYGSKRVGIAVTDPMQIIATGLTTVHAKDAIALLKDYTQKEEVECFVVGEPKNLDNSPAQSAPLVKNFVNRLKKNISKYTY